MPKNSMKVASR